MMADMHRKFTYGRSGEERNIYSHYNKKARKLK
jgi:hypothetical protein